MISPAQLAKLIKAYQARTAERATASVSHLRSTADGDAEVERAA